MLLVHINQKSYWLINMRDIFFPTLGIVSIIESYAHVSSRIKIKTFVRRNEKFEIYLWDYHGTLNTSIRAFASMFFLVGLIFMSLNIWPFLPIVINIIAIIAIDCFVSSSSFVYSYLLGWFIMWNKLGSGCKYSHLFISALYFA